MSELKTILQLCNIENKKALLFDCDGTLANTMPAHNKAYELAFALNGVPFDMEEHKKWAPFGGDTLIDKTINQKGFGDKAESIISDKQKLLPICLEKFMEPNEDLVELIKQKSDTYTIMVVSNGRRKSIQQILDELGLTFYVHGLICKEDYDDAKPSPAPYLLAMETINVDPQDVIVFEDNEIGIESAMKANIESIVEVTFYED